jgi:hypothetical protein
MSDNSKKPEGCQANSKGLQLGREHRATLRFDNSKKR